MVGFLLGFHLPIPLASLQVPGKPNFRERERASFSPNHLFCYVRNGLMLNTKSTNSDRTQGPHWSAEVSVVGWGTGDGACATDENSLPLFLLSLK